jgi:hypothetical protein
MNNRVWGGLFLLLVVVLLVGSFEDTLVLVFSNGLFFLLECGIFWGLMFFLECTYFSLEVKFFYGPY